MEDTHRVLCLEANTFSGGIIVGPVAQHSLVCISHSLSERVYERLYMSTSLTEVQKNLRVIRKSKGLTLHKVELLSNGMHKAVVVGSYERGSRSISVDRLISLAIFYDVPVSDFFGLPRPASTPKMAYVPMDYLMQLIAANGQAVVFDGM